MLAWAENRLWRSHGLTTAAALLACRSFLDQSPASYRRGELVGCWDLWFAINLWKERIGEPVGRRFGKLRRSWTATGLELGRVEWRQTNWQRQGNMKGQVAVRLYGMILGLVIWNLEIKGLWLEKENTQRISSACFEHKPGPQPRTWTTTGYEISFAKTYGW